MAGLPVDPDHTAVLLLTRPRESAERFAQQVRESGIRGVEFCVSPLMEISDRDAALDLADVRGVIFTSQQGVAAASRLTSRRDRPCHCVGRATADLADSRGWTIGIVADTADALVKSLISEGIAGPLLHIGGEHRRGEIASRLSEAGVTTREQVVYAQNLLPLSPEAIAALDGVRPVIAPLFSPRTARHFARQHRGGAPLWIAAMSAAVAEPLETLPISGIEHAVTPDADAMIETVRLLLNRATRVEGNPRAD